MTVTYYYNGICATDHLLSEPEISAKQTRHFIWPRGQHRTYICLADTHICTAPDLLSSKNVVNLYIESMQDSSFQCLCEVCVFPRKDGSSYIALLQKEVCVGVDLLGVDISYQGSPPPLSTPGPQIRWDETHDFSACATSSCSTPESWFQTYPEIQLESTASNDLMKAGFADPAAFGLPVRGLICQSPQDWFATRLVSLPRLSSLMRASAGTCTSTILQFCPAKKSTVTTHPQQCREENQGPSHSGSSLVSLGKYCKNPVTSRDCEHLNNAIGLFAPMAACCTSSVDMAISQTWQPKVTNTLSEWYHPAFVKSMNETLRRPSWRVPWRQNSCGDVFRHAHDTQKFCRACFGAMPRLKSHWVPPRDQLLQRSTVHFDLSEVTQVTALDSLQFCACLSFLPYLIPLSTSQSKASKSCLPKLKSTRQNSLKLRHSWLLFQL